MRPTFASRKKQASHPFFRKSASARRPDGVEEGGRNKRQRNCCVQKTMEYNSFHEPNIPCNPAAESPLRRPGSRTPGAPRPQDRVGSGPVITARSGSARRRQSSARLSVLPSREQTAPNPVDGARPPRFRHRGPQGRGDPGRTACSFRPQGREALRDGSAVRASGLAA